MWPLLLVRCRLIPLELHLSGLGLKVHLVMVMGGGMIVGYDTGMSTALGLTGDGVFIILDYAARQRIGVTKW